MSAPLRRAWPLVALALVGLLPLRLAAAPLDIIRGCAAQAPADMVGIKRLDDTCPGLEDAIHSLNLDGMLYDGWRERLNSDSLSDVAILVDLYRRPKRTAGLDTTALPGILKNVARELAPEPKSWWDAFKAWLKSWFQGRDFDSLSWLDRWLDSIGRSATLLNVILYSLIGLVVILAGWVVFNELRAAGLPVRRRPRTAQVISLSGVALGAATTMESEPVALRERMAALLRRLVARLMQTGRLKSERSLTHRELVIRSAFDSEGQRAVFAAVASNAEAILYGADDAPAEHFSRVLRDGEILLAQLPDSASRR